MLDQKLILFLFHSKKQSVIDVFFIKVISDKKKYRANTQVRPYAPYCRGEPACSPFHTGIFISGNRLTINYFHSFDGLTHLQNHW
ncbi:hypothetical protein BGP_4160 [Beggiatoa sp. PS]|nr:hypothetical protein BGP_4160 [Beggiatoa sp. PS]